MRAAAVALTPARITALALLSLGRHLLCSRMSTTGRTKGKSNAGRRPQATKAASIYDVAREARVSVFTVSGVINNKGRVSATLARRVEAAVRKLNYRPNLLARSLAKRQTYTLGMIVTDIANQIGRAHV